MEHRSWTVACSRDCPLGPALKGPEEGAVAPGGRAGRRQAQAALRLQPAEAVLVGHPGGHAEPAGGGAGAPGRAPLWAGDPRHRRRSHKAGRLESWGEKEGSALGQDLAAKSTLWAVVQSGPCCFTSLDLSSFLCQLPNRSIEWSR